MRSAPCKILAILVACTVLTTAAQAGQLVSSMKNVSAYMEYAGYQISPVTTTTMPGDYSPAQLFEIVRPSMGKVTLGRLYTSCTCIQLSATKKSFGYGEQALLTLRNVRPTNGKTYPFYVQVTSPIKATLRYDAYVISDQFVVAPPVVVPEVPAEAIEVTEVPAEAVEETETPAEAVDAADAPAEAVEKAEVLPAEPVAVEPEEIEKESEEVETAPEEKQEDAAPEQPAEEKTDEPEAEPEQESESDPK